MKVEIKDARMEAKILSAKIAKAGALRTATGLLLGISLVTTGGAGQTSRDTKQSSATNGSHAQVVVLGTGTPIADPERSGPAVAVVVGDAAYLVDCGPGVVRRAAAAEKAGIKALAVKNLKLVFITHLHSDHTVGYPDLIFTPWVLKRSEPLTAYGPRGLRKMTEHIEKAWEKDVYVRTHGLEEANRTGYKVVVHEIAPGVVYRDANVKVTAFLVKHGIWDQAYGYRFDTADRRIVISGDTAPAESVVQACDGCDVLLHEIYDPKREEQIIRTVVGSNRGPLDAQGIRRLFERIIDESRRIERVTAEAGRRRERT